MAKEIKTIGVLTSGGDAPGMNPAIRAVVRTAINKGLKVKGIQKGYNGLINDEIIDMDKKSVSDIIQRGGTILYTAIQELENHCHDRDTQAFKRQSAIKFAELVYDGKWFTPLRESMSAMFDVMDETVTGEVRLKLYKGSVTPAGAKSPYSLYNEDIASFGDSHELYSHKDSEGFINLFGLPLKVRAMMKKKNGFDKIVVIGGDGSFRGAQKLAETGVNTIGLPGTIDLDIACTDYTIGFDTAVNTAMEAIDKIRDTSTSHERCSIIEVMGRNAGYIALWCGIANGAEDILLPERYNGDEQAIINHIIDGRKKGKKHHLIINAEGIGHSTGMARRIEAATGIETRATILGYMQRGGSPTCKDRMYASIMGSYAVDLLVAGKSNRLVAYKDGRFVDYDIDEALAMTKDISDYEFNISAMLSN